MCVHLSVYPWAYLPNRTRKLYQFYACFAYRRDLILLWRGDEVPRGKVNFGSFLSQWQCIVQHSIWEFGDPHKNGRIDRDAVWDDDWGGIRYRVLDGDPIPQEEKAILGET